MGVILDQRTMVSLPCSVHRSEEASYKVDKGSLWSRDRQWSMVGSDLREDRVSRRTRLLPLCDGIVWGCSSGAWPSYLRSGEDQGDSSKSFLMGAMLLVRPVPDAQRRWMARRVFSKWEGLQPSFVMIKFDIATKKRRYLYEQNL